jgi:uncharacterized protein (DUF488 family)
LILHTIGHGRRTLDDFIALLKKYEISAIADVRTTPASRWAPWFNRAQLSQTLEGAGITYVFLGDELGGRPNDNYLYTPDGHVRYRVMSETPLFTSGFDRLVTGAKKFRLAVMCSEGDHHDCHRNLLIGRVAANRDIPVVHINKSGETEPFDESLIHDDTLFETEPDEWISAVKVR